MSKDVIEALSLHWARDAFSSYPPGAVTPADFVTEAAATVKSVEDAGYAIVKIKEIGTYQPRWDAEIDWNDKVDVPVGTKLYVVSE